MRTLTLFSTLKVIAIALCLFAIYSVAPAEAQIPAGVELNGYAWSANVGWISLNCRTGGASEEDVCTTSNYKVVVNPNRNITGYAWSSNIGWIRFGGLETMTGSTFPIGSNTVAASARLENTVYRNTNLEGWIRACAGTASITGYCGNGANNPNSGGWDGWISLKGTGYGVNTANFGDPQYVWGSDVVGWIDMSTHVNWYSLTELTGIGCTITTIGESTCSGVLNWSFAPGITNPTIVRTSPTSPSIPNLTGATGTNRSATLQLGNNTFAARSGANGANLVSRTVTASCGGGLVEDEGTGTCQLPTAGDITITSLTAAPSIVRRGGTARIDWVLSADPAGQCTLSGPNTNQVITGQTGSITTPALTATARFTLDCGASEKDVVITVVPAFNEV